jgi:hypothetical protein
LQDVPATLDAAAGNFGRFGAGTASLMGALLLTQTARERIFEALVAVGRAGDWRLDSVPGEPESLIASRGGRRLAVVCGRQVRADDGLEVAGLGTRREFCDGQPFADSLTAALDSGAVVAIPWGFGKWTGRRGQLVDEVTKRTQGAPVFLSDSGSRSGVFGEPALIRRGRQRGVRVLAGTDPFPFGGDYRRVGGFGFLADVDPDPAAPWGSLRSWLVDPRSTPITFGRASGPMRFLINQVGVQVHNRLSGAHER